MNKKQKNKSLVKRSLRNRMINQRYRSTIKTLLKLFKKTNGHYLEETVANIKDTHKVHLADIANKIFSFADKAVKKNVFHQNKSNRIKSQIAKLFLYCR